MSPLDEFRKEAEEALFRALKDMGIMERPTLERAAPGFGDAAFPCFPLARTLRKSPVKIAEELAEACRSELEKSGKGLIERVEAVNGYLNFHYNQKMLSGLVLSAVLEHGKDFGQGEKRPGKIILEHTSANPNGPFHVGRARNPIIGDTLARILSFAGWDVETEYYVNDMGKQAVILYWGVENLKGKVKEGKWESEWLKNEAQGGGNEISSVAGGTKAEAGDTKAVIGDTKDDHRLVPFYQEASRLLESEPEVLEEINSLLERYERGDRALGEAVRNYCNLVLEGMKQTLSVINIAPDRYVYESDFVYSGEVERIIERLKASPYCREEEGAFYLELEDFGIHGRDTRFFFTRKGGTSLYTTRDLAYHMDKFRRAGRVIDVLGEDHKLQAQQLAIALGELGEKRRPEVVFYAFVSLPEGKMSTRRGRVVYFDHLIEEALERAYLEVEKRRPELSEEEKRRISMVVGTGAIRYNIARVQMEKAMVFRWEDALNFEGDSAPFIQYTHARACSILRKTEESGGESGTFILPTPSEAAGLLTDPNEIALIREIARLPGVVEECAEGLKIHPLAGYLRELAGLFNQFYRECPVLNAEPGMREARLLLVHVFRTVVASGLGLLGIEAPEFM